MVISNFLNIIKIGYANRAPKVEFNNIKRYRTLCTFFLKQGFIQDIKINKKKITISLRYTSNAPLF